MLPQGYASNRAAAHAGFTLIELLVAIAVMALILQVMFSMIKLAGSAWSQGHSRIDNFTRARAMLDLIAGDVERGVFRTDLPAFCTGNALVTGSGVTSLQSTGTNSIVAFFTCRPGVGNNERDLSLVSYSLVTSSNAALNRSYLSIPWTPPGGSTGNWSSMLPFQADLAPVISGSSVTPMNTAQGVVGFELLFRRSDGSLTNSYTGYQPANPVVGVVIGLAVIDSQTLLLLNQQSKLATLKSALASTAVLTGTNSAKAEWDAALNAGTFFQGYPSAVKTGLKTFERDVFCESAF